MWIHIHHSGQDIDMVEGPTVVGPGIVAPGAKALIAQNLAIAIPAPKQPTIGRGIDHNERTAIDLMSDGDWKTAKQLAYGIGIGNGLERIIYRLIKAEGNIKLLEGDLLAARNQSYEFHHRLMKLEGQIRKVQAHDETEQRSTSTARNGNGQTGKRLSAAGR